MIEDRSLKLDVLALALLALTVFTGIALFTYDAQDPPSTIVYPASEVVHNACGRSGAFAAHYLFQGLGYGAYYLGGSLAILTGLLLVRKEITQPVLRAFGWVGSLVALTTLASLALGSITPGPVIGAGGYLGAVCEGLLETNFATVGAYILALSVLFAGLLLCTDYILVGVAAATTVVTAKGLAHVGKMGQAAGRAAMAVEKPKLLTATVNAEGDAEAEEDEEEWEYEDEEEAEGEEGEYEEGEYEEEEVEVEDAGDAITIRTAKDIAEEAAKAEKESEAAEAKEGDKAAGGVKNRIKSALGIKTSKDRKRAEREAVLNELDEAVSGTNSDVQYELPPLDLLLESDDTCNEDHKREVRRKAKMLEQTFESFGFNVKVVEVETGPVIAQYEVELEAGLRLSKITGLADDIAIALRVPSVRIVAPIPGKNTVGIEIPNEHRQLVRLREVIEETNGKAKRLKIPIYLGKDVSGNPMVIDLASMPHLLIAGRTGTGKSVCLNSIIISILMGRGPDEVRMLMIDPKMVELSPYKKLPHLMHPVVTDMRKAEAILGWAVEKMEERYSLLAAAGVRHVSVYNQLGDEELRERLKPEDEESWEKLPKHLPYIVIIADEIADLMMTAGKDVEQHIIRLAQKSRAVGIHLVLATQKPTVDVITGLIKSNLPARLAFQVASRTDSRVVLDEMGADRLLGNGDMLFLSPGTSTLHRGQGTYLSDDEITRVVDFVGTDAPEFEVDLVQLKTKEEVENEAAGKPTLKKRDDLYESAVDVCVREGRGSVSLLQRTLGIGYGRAARLIDYMAEDKIVGDYNGSQAREILISVSDWEAMNGEEPNPDPDPPKPKRTNKIKLSDSAPIPPAPKSLSSTMSNTGSGVASALLTVRDALAPWEQDADKSLLESEDEDQNENALEIEAEVEETEEQKSKPRGLPPWSQQEEAEDTEEDETEIEDEYEEEEDELEEEPEASDGETDEEEAEGEADEEDEYEYEYEYVEVDEDDPEAELEEGEEYEYEEVEEDEAA